MNYLHAPWRASFKKRTFVSRQMCVFSRREGFVLHFCSTFRIEFYVMFCKNLRSPFQNNTPCCFVHCVRIPFIFSPKQKRDAVWRPVLLWRRERDSNPRGIAPKLISSHRALIPFSASTCLFLPNFARFGPIFQDLLSKSPQN